MVAQEFFLNWDCGFLAGPTDVTHPLYTSAYCPFNLLWLFKDEVVEVNRIPPRLRHACMSPFLCTKNTLITVYVYVRSACSVLRVCLRRQRAAYAYRKILSMPATFSWRLFAPFRTQKRAAYVGLRHARMNAWTQKRAAYAGLRHAHATLSLLSRLVLSCKN